MFIEDVGADGFKVKPDDGTTPDTYGAGGKRTAFDGDWNAQKVSESEYQTTFTTAGGL